jgi:hypothetical protein
VEDVEAERRRLLWRREAAGVCGLGFGVHYICDWVLSFGLDIHYCI